MANKEMTKQEAIDRILDHMQAHHIGEYPHLRLAVALKMAIAALNEQDCAKNAHCNEPLTQEELRGMVGEWVWVVVDYQHGDQRYQCDGWALVALPTFVAYLDQTLPIDFYGKKFLAYRHKLEVAARG